MMRNGKMVLLWLSLGMGACSDEKTLDLHNPPPKSFRVLVSGEEMLAHGIRFPPSTGTYGGHAIYFEDGWEISFESALVTLAHVQLSENPDMSSGDPSKTGPVVAELEGVFAVELKSSGGFGSHGHEHALGILAKQNKKKGLPAFDAQTRYAFGYSLVRATPEAVQLGLGETSQADYVRMQEKGYSVFVRGSARFKGGEQCRNAVTYDFKRLPEEFRFELGFDMPVTYKNCQNPQLGASVRGVQVKDNAFVDVVATLHFDHLFWEALKEDAPLRLDAWAARKTTEAGAAPDMTPVTNADLAKVNYLAVEDAQKNEIPVRYCGTLQEGEKKAGEVLSYGDNRVGGLQNLNDFIQYNLSTFGHLNEDGLCHPQREY